MVGAADSDQVSKHVGMFGRLVPPVEQPYRCEVVDFQPSSELATVFVIADSTDDTPVSVPL